MAYQALYRVWRSQRFADVVGQQAVTKTLQNAIAQSKISHAYLFSGPRGTGKTSAAKIFAKAVNCPHQHNGEPCNECDICKEITAGSCNDVLEIDAASNNGVEEIRDIREKVKYAPTQATYKVYIIDEVHMLSTGAFNALLKTLEEPPRNVIFILATTEPHKIPATIISRTQRFDFKRITTVDIVSHMAMILEKMEIPYEEQALYVVARAAEGGMRDALSILDQAISFSDEKLTVADAMQVTGSLTYEMMDQYLSACNQGETEQALEVLENLLREGKEASRFLEDLLLYCRDLLMYQQAPKLLEEKAGQLTDTFKQLGETIAPETLYRFIQILSETKQELRFSNHPAIYLEVATVKLATNTNSSGTKNPSSAEETGTEKVDHSAIEQLQAEVKRLSQELTELKKQGAQSNHTDSAPRQSAEKPTRKQQVTYRVPKERVYQVLQAATKQDLLKVKDVWSDLLNMLTVTQRAMLKASDVVAASDQGMVIIFDYEILCQRASDDQDLQQAVRDALGKLIQYEPEMVCIPTDSWGDLRKAFLSQSHHEMPANAGEAEAPKPQAEEKDRAVDEALELFGSAVEIVND